MLLIDVVSLSVIRMWKSYRDAQFGWVMYSPEGQAAHAQRNSAVQPMHDQVHPEKRHKSDRAPEDDSLAPQHGQTQAASLHLVLYAPRRRSLELWQVRLGPRVATLQLAGPCKLLQRSLPFGLTSDSNTHVGNDFCSRAAVQGAEQCLIVDVSSGQSIDVLAALHLQTIQERKQQDSEL